MVVHDEVRTINTFEVMNLRFIIVRYKYKNSYFNNYYCYIIIIIILIFMIH